MKFFLFELTAYTVQAINYLIFSKKTMYNLPYVI
jgi:hypothetical protein